MAEGNGMTYGQEKIRIRRFLRDPDGNIWSDSFLETSFNEAQREIQQKTRMLEDVVAVMIPPVFPWTYIFDFEWPFLYSTTQPHYQAFHYYQDSEYVITTEWEGMVLADVDATFTEETGCHMTYPWEAFVTTVADIVPMRFPRGFYEALGVYWDEQPIDFIEKKALSGDDSTWKTRSGKPQNYWRPDITEPFFALYPKPSSPVWDDETPDSITEVEYACSQDWENSSTYISTSVGVQFTREDADEETSVVFDWEYSQVDDYKNYDDDPVRGQHSFEVYPAILGSTEGKVFLSDGNIFTSGDGPLGGDVYTTDSEISTSAISAEDNVLFVYRKKPIDIDDLSDESSFPDFLQKYVEYSCLEMAYSADTDGQIDSLRDYWGFRKNLGIEIIKLYKNKRVGDRDYQFSTIGAIGKRTRRQPRLPDEYPPSY